MRPSVLVAHAEKQKLRTWLGGGARGPCSGAPGLPGCDLGYRNVEIRVGDGYQGWPEEGPFDAILLSAAPPKIPKPLLDQLRVGGKMVVAEGGFIQDLLVITKTADGLQKRTVIPVRLSPMTGRVRDGG